MQLLRRGRPWTGAGPAPAAAAPSEEASSGGPASSARAALRPALVVFAAFLVLWATGLEQYLFVPVAALLTVVVSRTSPRALRVPGALGWACLMMAALGAAAMVWSPHWSDAARTLNVWLSGLLVAAAHRSATARGRSALVVSFVLVWVASMAVYALAVAAPAVVEPLLAGKLVLGPATSTSFAELTYIYGLTVERPIGFLLYSNELAIFGVVAAALLLTTCRTSRPVQVAVAALAVLTLVLSTSRSLLLTAVAAGGVLVLTRLPGRDATPRRRAVTTLAVLAAGAAALAVLPLVLGRDWLARTGLVGARVGSSEELRSQSYSEGWRLFTEHPWTGVGGLPSVGDIQAGSHNLLLSALVRHGLLGGACVAVVLLVGLVLAGRALISGRAGVALRGAVLLMVLVSSAAIQFDDDALTFAAIVVLWTSLLDPLTGSRPLPAAARDPGAAQAGGPSGRGAEAPLPR